MTDKPNLAGQIHQVFAKIKPHSHPDKRTILQMWREALNLSDDFEAIRAIELIYKGLISLNERVLARPMSQRNKDNYKVVIDGMINTTLPHRLSHHVHQIYEFIDQPKLNFLATLTDAMYGDKPVARLSEADANELRTNLHDLTESIKSAAIREDLRALLTRHCSLMLWALDNADLIGIEGLYEAVMRAIIEAHRSNGADTTEEERSILHGVTSFGRAAMKIMDYADKIANGVTALTDMSDGISGLLAN